MSPAGEDEHLQLTTLAGWRQFVTEVPAVPNLLPDAVWSGLEDGKRACYDDDRIDHHSRLLIVLTPAIREVISSGRRLIQRCPEPAASRSPAASASSAPARSARTSSGPP